VVDVEILSSRVLLTPSDPVVTTAFYRDVLGLAVYREFPGGTVFFLGQGFLEVSGHGAAEPAGPARLWLQVRDLDATAAELTAAGVELLREPRVEPWGLYEMWVVDPDGLCLVFVQIPDDHPLRVDVRP
jgi:catechol 2,3-dioxygenase-like lactoylglutathione lyase family enzyme